ncbi:MAG: hypothetical protein WDA03_06755 [Trueperaceae bacterium]
MAYTALLDANVLYPAPIRDVLVQLATTGIYRARWTADIHQEWIDALLRAQPHRDRQRLERTRDVIVTRNLKDFPETVLQVYDVEAQDPDEFLCNHLASPQATSAPPSAPFANACRIRPRELMSTSRPSQIKA